MRRLRNFGIGTAIVFAAFVLFASFGGSASASSPCDIEFGCSVTVHISGSGSVDVALPPGYTGGTCTPSNQPCTFWYGSTVDYQVTLTANADNGYTLSSWDGDCAGQSNPCYLTANMTYDVTANFAPVYRLNVDVDPQGHGSVNSTPPGIKGCRGNAGTCHHDYLTGTSVTLTESETSSGYAFDHWSGVPECEGSTSTTCTVSMTSAKTVVAHFLPLYTLTASVSPSGTGTVSSNDGKISGCTTSCSASYKSGASTTLNASNSDSGYVFDHWTGVPECEGSTATSCTVSMDGAKGVTAVYVPQYTLTAGVSPSGTGTVASSDGKINSCTMSCVATYRNGTSVTLNASNSSSGYIFDHWTGDACSGSTSPSCSFTMNGSKNVTAVFVRQFTLTVKVDPIGGGTVTGTAGGQQVNCSDSCTYALISGKSVSLTATKAQDFNFSSWSGDVCNTSTSTSCSFTMGSDISVTAGFEGQKYQLNVTIDPSGAGAVAGSGVNCTDSCQYQFAIHKSVSLTASNTVPGFVFTGWGGDCAGTGACNLTMDSDHSVTAHYTRQYTLTASAGEGGSIKGQGIDCPGDCSEKANVGTAFGLTAQPANGYSFTGWTGACASFTVATTCTVTLNSDTSVGATFVKNSTPQGTFTLSVKTTGSGSVTCKPGPCDQKYASNTSVRLDATPAPGFNFAGWDGDCPDAPVSCTIVVNGSKVVTAKFTQDPVIADLPQSDQPAPVTATLEVNVSGNGTVVSTPVAAFGPMAVTDSTTIKCGVGGLSCFAQGTPDSTVRLTASAAAGYAFKGWQGACSDTKLTCRVLLSQVKFVTARFDPKNPAKTIKSSLKPQFKSVRWKESAGSGSLIVTGRVSRAARLTLQLRRSRTTGELVTRTFRAGAGGFTKRVKLPKSFGGGARLFPGGFVVSLRGGGGGYTVPLQIRTTALPAPPQGVVRSSYMSTDADGPVLSRISAGTKNAWAVFKFDAQPKASNIQVFWYFPNGRLVNFKQKANRPVIATELASNLPIPAGNWRVVLKVGGKPVKTQTVKILP